MLGKLAAIKLNTNTTKKVAFEWSIRTKDGKPAIENDALFEAFSKLYDMLDYNTKAEPFTIIIAGKSFKINKENYSVYNRDVKEEVSNTVQHDYDKDKKDRKVDAGISPAN